MILVDEALLNDDDSWKAAFLLCILSYEYKNVKNIFDFKTIKKLSPSIMMILKEVEQYPLACYLVEFLSHLEISVIQKLISDDFPINSYANDLNCQEFLKEFSVFAPNIIRFKSFNVNQNLNTSDESIIQINDDHLLILSEINEFATPFQIDFNNISLVTKNGNKLLLNLINAPKHALASPIEFSNDIQISIEFYSNYDISLILDSIHSNKINTSTPERKISVVENFIALNNFEDDEDEEEKEPDVLVAQTQDSEITESQSLFHSLINNTKDTTYSTKKTARAVSFIVAESTRVNDKLLSPEPSQQVIIESSQDFNCFQKPIEDEIIPKTILPKRKSSVDDIWDFISESDENNEISIAKAITKKKSIKCIPTPAKKNNQLKVEKERLQEKPKRELEKPFKKSVEKPVKSKKPIEKPKSVEKMIENPKEASQAELSSIINDTYSGFTSPTINAQVRANTRAMSILQNEINKRKAEPEAEKSTKKAKEAQPVEEPKRTRPKRNANKQKEKLDIKTLNEVFGSISGSDSDPIEEDEITENIIREQKEVESLKEPIEPSPIKPIEKISTKSIKLITPSNIQPNIPSTKPTNNLSVLSANNLLSEAYTTTLQKQIFESITTFSNQLVNKIQIINDAINKKVMSDLTNKYETLFSDLRESFQNDVDEISGFIGDVKGLLNLPEEELVNYIKEKKFGLNR